MSDRSSRSGFAARPVDPDRWIKAADTPTPPTSSSAAQASASTARLTVDITRELRGRIKIAAFTRGVTVADMLRELLAREFPDPKGETP